MTSPRWARWSSVCACGAQTEADGGLVVRDPPSIRCLPCAWTPPPRPELLRGRVYDDPGQRIADNAALYAYQRIGADWLSRARAALLADEPGLGKTAQALTAWSTLGHPPAVAIVPPSCRRQWAREAGRWAPAARARVQETTRAWLPPRQGELLVMGYPAVRGLDVSEAPPGLLVILDEAQAIKDPGTKQTRGARRLCAAALGSGGRVWLLTATPAYADAAQAWEVLRAAELHRALSPSVATWETRRPKDQERALARVMLRRRAQDELDLPALRVETLTVEIGAQEAVAIDRAAAEAVASRRLAEEGAEVSPETVARRAGGMTSAQVQAALTQLLEGEGEDGVELALSTVRRLVATAKLGAAEELAEQHEASGTPLVVFADHRDPVLALADRPGWGAVIGGQTPADRAASVAAFREGGAGIAVTYGAGGTGLDGLQTRASRAILLELAWTPAQVEQALGRLLRIGQTGPSVLATILVAEHWVDEVVTGVLRRKLGALAGLGLGLSLAGKVG